MGLVMLEKLKQLVYETYLKLVESGLILLDLGSVSCIDRDSGMLVITPFSDDTVRLSPKDMSVIDLSGGRVEGEYAPCPDAMTHCALYKLSPELRGIVHTNSRWATVWAQSGRSIPAYGTAHASYFYGDIPCTRKMRRHEICGSYERNAGHLIHECHIGKSVLDIPAALVYAQGAYAWGKTLGEAVRHAAALEHTAMMAYHTEVLGAGQTEPIQELLLSRHFSRRHGGNFSKTGSDTAG